MCMYGVNGYVDENNVDDNLKFKEERKYKKSVLEITPYMKDLEDNEEFKEWASIYFDEFMFYEKIKRGHYIATCERCREEVKLTRARSGRRIECPNCGAKVLLKSGTGVYGQKECFAYLSKQRGYLAQQLCVMYKDVFFSKEYRAFEIRYLVVEEERDVLIDGRVYYTHPHNNWLDNTKKWITGPGKYHGMNYSHWRITDRNMYLFPDNVERVLKGTDCQYSQLLEANEQLLVNPLEYLELYLRKPQLEMLVKLRLWRMTAQLYNGEGGWNYYRAEKPLFNLTSIKLKDLGIDSVEEARTCGKYTYGRLMARKEVKAWGLLPEEMDKAIDFVYSLNDQCGEDFKYSFISRKAMYVYSLAQKEQYKEPHDFIRNYTDYISDCLHLKMNVNDTAVKKPKDLSSAHDTTMREVKEIEQRKWDEGIREAFAKAHEYVEFSAAGLSIKMPETSAEIVKEGAKLHHCVGNYCKRVAKNDCYILFIRKDEEPAEAYFTMEINPNLEKLKIVQCRGSHNVSYGADVEELLKEYETWFNKRSCDVLAAV